MAISYRSRFSIESIFTSATWGMGVLALLFGAFFGFRSTRVEGLRALHAAGTRPMLDGFGTGPLALKESSRPALAISLEEMLKLVAQSARPDFSRIERRFSLGVIGSEETRVATEGEKVFLSVVTDERGGIESVTFSNQPTPYSLTPVNLEGESLTLTLEGEEIAPVDLFLDAKFVKKSAAPLWSAHVEHYGPDLLIEKYGGEQYRAFAGKEKLVIEGKRVLFVGKGDYLSCKDGVWQVLPSLDAADRSLPLAHVRDVTPSAVDIVGWDEQGFPSFQVSIPKVKEETYRPLIKKALSNCRARTAKQVVCELDQKRIILKEGDWLLKGESGWTKLKTLSEVEACLSHEARGHLLIIDSVDPKKVIQGHLFNEMRTQVHPFSIPVRQTPEKTVKRVRSRRR